VRRLDLDSAQLPAFQPDGRPTWAEVDLTAVEENYRTMSSLLRVGGMGPSLGSLERSGMAQAMTLPPRILPIIKADAYGHGATAVAQTLAAMGVAAFAVAIVEEGAALRRSGIGQEILVLQGAWPGQEIECLANQLTPVIYSPDGIRRLEQAACSRGGVVPCHIKVDTGMARLGVSWDALEPLVEELKRARHLELRGTFTHLASAEELDPAYTQEQIRRFECSLRTIRGAGLLPGELHCANSSGLLYHDQLRHFSARLGISLYGYAPAPERCPVPLRRALSLKTRIGRLQTVAPGQTVGYNRRFKAVRHTRAATLPVGYADGYRHALTGRGRVIIHDRWAPVLGAVAMDMIVIDVTDIPEVAEGDEVILLGSSPHCRMDARDWAELAGTIPYEVLCGISPRIPRVYLGRVRSQDSATTTV
jgi:alanine racemase